MASPQEITILRDDSTSLQEKLDLIFSLVSPWKRKDFASVCVFVKDACGQSLSGFKWVSREKLSNYRYTLSQDACFPHHLHLHLEDFVWTDYGCVEKALGC